MKTYSAKVFSTDKYELGESPFYDVRTKTLSWVDITKGTFFTQKIDDVNPAGEKKSFCFEKPIGAAVPAENPGSYIIAGTDALYILENETATPVKNLSDYYKAYQRSNDAKADPAGRLWFGSSVDDGVHEASGNLFCLDKGKVICRQPDTKISNGMAWSHDRKKFYFSDSLQYAVFVYNYDLSSGEISNRKVLFKAENTVTDGMCIDSEDNLWVAFWDGHRIEQRSGKDGSLLATVNVEATNVTSCCFIGNNLDTLFITTSGRNQNGKYDGCLFTCKVDVKGLPCDYASLQAFTIQSSRNFI